MCVNNDHISNFILGQPSDCFRMNLELCLLSSSHLDRRHIVTTMDRDRQRDTYIHIFKYIVIKFFLRQLSLTLKRKSYFWALKFLVLHPAFLTFLKQWWFMCQEYNCRTKEKINYDYFYDLDFFSVFRAKKQIFLHVRPSSH